MTIRLKPLSEQVIVITGGSSGMGLATAKLAADRGAKVVLAARTRDALAKAVDEIKQAGGEAVFAVADVGDRQQLEGVAQVAIERFGRIDTWVNNAGVGIMGKIEEVEEADMRRLFDTNFWGVVNGSQIAVRHLKESGGALIILGSVLSDRAFAMQGIYSASKHAVKGFTDALRSELEDDGAPISVTLIKPGAMGTPMTQHVKNYRDEEAKFPPPVYDPNEAAKTILRAAEHPMRSAFIGGAARIGAVAGNLLPTIVDWISAKVMTKAQFQHDKLATQSDNLFEGNSDGRVRGETESVIRPSLYAKAARHPRLTGVAIAAGIGALLYGWRRRSGHSPQN